MQEGRKTWRDWCEATEPETWRGGLEGTGRGSDGKWWHFLGKGSCTHTEDSCTHEIASDKRPDASPAVGIGVAEGMSEIVSRSVWESDQEEKNGNSSLEKRSYWGVGETKVPRVFRGPGFSLQRDREMEHSNNFSSFMKKSFWRWLGRQEY